MQSKTYIFKIELDQYINQLRVEVLAHKQKLIGVTLINNDQLKLITNKDLNLIERNNERFAAQS